MVSARNILIFHLGALGDFVLTWPLALALARLYPQSRIFYITHGTKGRLAEMVLRIESADIEAGWDRLFSPDASLPESPRKLLAGAHSIFTFLSDGHDVWSQNVGRLAPGAGIYPLIWPPVPGTGAAAGLVGQLQGMPAVAKALELMLGSLGRRGIAFRREPGGPLVIHPGGSSRPKCWPAANFIELAARWSRRGRPVRLVLGEVELERWTPREIAAASTVADVVRPCDYLELLRVLTSASLFLGNDSGPGQLAGIIGLSTFILFGPTDPGVWLPLGPAVRMLRRQPLSELTVDAVDAWVASRTVL